MPESTDRICQHCEEFIVGNAYRVTSEEKGIAFFDLIVCSLCFMEAKGFTLMARKSMSEAHTLRLKILGVTAGD